MNTWKRAIRTVAFTTSLAIVGASALAEQPEDAWITTKVKLALLTDETVDGTDVNVDTFDGKVTLHGKVSTADEKARATTRAKAVVGVTAVENLLAVSSRERSVAKGDDAALRERVHAKLRAEGALAHSDVRVSAVANGVVTLGGTAESLSAELRAVHAARDVDGVRSVVNEIEAPDQLADDEVWGGEAGGDANFASDAWITAKAKIALMADPGISPTRVNVDTRDGAVTMFGSVSTENDRLRAAEEVQKLDGVKRVMNELQVVPDVASDRVAESDDKLSEEVRKRLAERESLSDSKIDIATENGVVRLTGTVESQRDRLTALTVARNTRGVRAIVDGLEPEPKAR